MFGWFKKKAEQRERQIYKYWNGEKHCQIDPAEAWHELWNAPDAPLDKLLEDVAKAIDVSKYDTEKMTPEQNEALSEDVAKSWKESRSARREVLALVRRVFNVKQFSDTSPGLTLDEQEELFGEFFNYMTGLKKKPPTSPPSSSPAATNSSGGNSRTNGKSVSHSTSKA